VRGVGQVAVTHAVLTNGVENRRSRSYAQRKILGRRTPGRGLPSFDWTANTGAVVLRFT